MIEIIVAIMIVSLAVNYALFIILCAGNAFETKKEFLIGLIPFYIIITLIKRYWDEFD